VELQGLSPGADYLYEVGVDAPHQSSSSSGVRLSRAGWRRWRRAAGCGAVEGEGEEEGVSGQGGLGAYQSS